MKSFRSWIPVLAIVVSAACAAQQPKARAIPVGEWPATASAGTIRGYEKALREDPSAFGVRLELARVLGAAGRFEEAAEQGELAVRSKPDSAEAWVVLAHAYANQAEWALAMNASQRALTLDPQNPEAHFTMGWSYVNLEQYPQGRASLENALLLRPEYFDALRALGVAAARLNDFPSALRAWDKAVALRPEAKDLIRASVELKTQLSQNLQPLRDRVALRPNDWAGYAALGDRAAFLGLYGEALPAYYEAARLGVDQADPARSAQLFHNIGVVYRQMDNYDKALVMFERALLLNPGSAATHYNIGLVHTKLGDDEEAVRAFEVAARFEKESVAPFVALAEAYLRTGRVRAALDQYDIVKRHDARSADKLMREIKAAQSGTAVVR